MFPVEDKRRGERKKEFLFFWRASFVHYSLLIYNTRRPPTFSYASIEERYMIYTSTVRSFASISFPPSPHAENFRAEDNFVNNASRQRRERS